MKQAIFLDVDKTLTVKIIQETFAEALGCLDEYTELETQFQEQSITSRQFGDRIIRLYAEKGLSRHRANELFDKVRLQPWADELIKLGSHEDKDVYLVSSGPNYYIDAMANRFNLTKDKVLCSRYHFEGADGMISRCDPVDEMQKADFVNRILARGEYDYSIGVGDSPAMDGPFLSSCSIGFLIEPSDSHFFAPTIQSIIRHSAMVQDLGDRLSVPREVGPINLKTLKLSEILGAMTLGSWLAIIGVFTTGFALGSAALKLFG